MHCWDDNQVIQTMIRHDLWEVYCRSVCEFSFRCRQEGIHHKTASTKRLESGRWQRHHEDQRRGFFSLKHTTQFLCIKTAAGGSVSMVCLCGGLPLHTLSIWHFLITFVAPKVYKIYFTSKCFWWCPIYVHTNTIFAKRESMCVALKAALYFRVCQTWLFKINNTY